MTEQRRIEKMHENQEELCVCPTFNSYSSDKLAIAARVTDEMRTESNTAGEKQNDDDDFEFSLVREDPEIYYTGQIQPIFPIFNRDLLFDDSEGNNNNNKQSSDEGQSSEIRIPLKNLFLEERDPPSSSSSEADELENVPPGTYCVWRPKTNSESPNRCKKSNSTGSASRRWKFLDLLRRSNSDGKDSYVFLTPKVDHREDKSDKIERSKVVLKRSPGRSNAKPKPIAAAASPSSSAHEAFYVRNRAIKEGDKKKSYLPYRQDLVGFFASVNSLSKTFSPV